MKETGTYFKYLPDGSPSLLSLNDFVVCGAGAERTGKEIYSMQMLAGEAERAFADYDSGKDRDVVGFLNRKTEGSAKERELAYRITDSVAEGLAQLFYALYAGSDESRRQNHLTEADWAFWKNCSRIFMVGRLAEGNTGRRLEESIMRCFTGYGEADTGIRIRCLKHPQIRTVSLLGCARAAGGEKDTVYVFDFGNTAVKCGRAVYGPCGYAVDERPAVIHRDYGGMDNTVQTARQIHREIAEAILQTIGYYGGDRTECSVSLCMANNIVGDEIMDRGSYRSLRLLAPSYGDFLRRTLEGETGGSVNVSLMNDARAVAELFSEWAPEAAVVTLGTHMGIAYPDSKKNNKK